MLSMGIDVFFQGKNLIRLLGGLWVTIRISILSVVISIALGVLLGMLMTIKNPFIKLTSKIYLEFIRIMPQLVLLFMVYFGLTKAFRINLSGELSALLVFVMWGSAEMGDLVRGALLSIPKHQYESGGAIGLTKLQVYWYIIIPQTIRRVLPTAINLITRMIKTTSLVVLIGVVEVVKVGQQIIEAARLSNPNAAIWVYGFIFFLYFIVCYPISLLSSKLEKIYKN